MPKAKKEVKELPKKEYLDENFKAPSIKAKFNLQQLILKDLEWKMKIKIEDILPKTYYQYEMAMIFDESPYLRKLASLEDQIQDIRDSRQKPLFKDDTEERVDDLKTEIEEQREAMDEKRRECRTIKMICRVEELKYAGMSTLLTFIIPDDVINDLNEQKLKFGYYIIELTPMHYQAVQNL
jgi:hypothetical protein